MMVMGIFGADGEKELIRFSVWKKIKFIPYPILFIRFLMLPIDKFFNPLPHQSSKTSAYRRFKATFLNSSFSLDINQSLDIRFLQQPHNNSYSFKETCMIIPTYTAALVKRIAISGGFQAMVLEGNEQDIANLYAKLSRVMSHKGFTDFYKPIKRLGRGNFATVYLVEHKYTGIRRAAKVFSKVGQGIEYMGNQALANEIKTLKEINHPNLISFDGLYQTQSLVYLVTEYLSGGTLDDTLKNKSMYTGELIQSILKDLLSGLAYLDSKHIMHRDIKPENVILREQDQKWVIGDFGLAARSDQEYIYDKCGTMGYIAPEIMELNQNQKYKQACDTYSLGVIAYQLIVGELPFKVEAENFFDKKIVWVLFDREICKKIHPSILNFLQKLLDKNPQTRITPKQALNSPFFTDKQVVNELFEFHEKRRQDRYDRILKMANSN